MLEHQYARAGRQLGPPRPSPSPGDPDGALSSRTPIRGTLVYVVAAATLIVLNVADVVVTRLALDAGATELNPITRFFVEHAVAAYAIKITAPAVVLALALSRSARGRVNGMHIAAIWTVVGMYLMAVFLNVVTLTTYS